MSEAHSTCASEENPEVWIAIPGYEGLYEVSSLGNVRLLATRNGSGFHELSTPKPKMLSKGRTGYAVVSLTDRNGKTKGSTVQRVVLSAFVGPCPLGHEAAHKNGNRLDNRLDNLEWVTIRENAAHKRMHGTQPLGQDVHNAKLKEYQIPEIRIAYFSGENKKDIARRYGVDPGVVRRIISGEAWNDVDDRQRLSSEIAWQAKRIAEAERALTDLRAAAEGVMEAHRSKWVTVYGAHDRWNERFYALERALVNLTPAAPGSE